MHTSRTITLLIGDSIVFFLALALMVAIELWQIPTPETLLSYASAFFIPFLLTILICYIANLYETGTVVPTPQSSSAFILSAGVSGVLTALYFYLFPNSGITPKTNLVIVAVSFLVLLFSWRQLFGSLFTRWLGWKVYLIGHNEEMHRLHQSFNDHQDIGRVVGSSPTLNDYRPGVRADILIVASEEDVGMIEQTTKLPIPLITARRAFEQLFGRTPLSLFTVSECLLILGRRRMALTRLMWRAFEVVVAFSVLLIFLPFLLVAALAIWLEDRGPVIYRQERVGLKKKPFMLLKLRTMRENAEIHGALWAAKNDPRTTGVGRFIRKLHLDEVLQMINVLKGELALVGPRPERSVFVEELEREVPFYFLRHLIKPGFTGWAQIKYRYARSVEDSKEKFEYDLYYLRHRSLPLDLGILVKTVQIIFTHL